MAYFSDLSPYRYEGAQEGVLHVGWLDGVHPFSKGEVARHLIQKMIELAKNPTELYRGLHLCEVCKRPSELQPFSKELAAREAWWRWMKPRSSNGEIRVTGNGVIYAAPVLITHYIEAHGYLPPTEFLNAIEMHRME
jgi:hypothetical protein